MLRPLKAHLKFLIVEIICRTSISMNFNVKYTIYKCLSNTREWKMKEKKVLLFKHEFLLRRHF